MTDLVDAAASNFAKLDVAQSTTGSDDGDEVGDVLVVEQESETKNAEVDNNQYTDGDDYADRKDRCVLSKLGQSLYRAFGYAATIVIHFFLMLFLINVYRYMVVESGWGSLRVVLSQTCSGLWDWVSGHARSLSMPVVRSTYLSELVTVFVAMTIAWWLQFMVNETTQQSFPDNASAWSKIRLACSNLKQCALDRGVAAYRSGMLGNLVLAAGLSLLHTPWCCYCVLLKKQSFGAVIPILWKVFLVHLGASGLVTCVLSYLLLWEYLPDDWNHWYVYGISVWLVTSTYVLGNMACSFSHL